jgi:dolichol-phosphate mannosyltransferase
MSVDEMPKQDVPSVAAPSEQRLRVLAVPVVFNEEKKIGRVLDRFTPGLVDEIVVVDDGSTDGSAAEVEKRGIKVIRHSQRKGVGAAIRTGIHYAKDHGFDVIVILAGNDKDRPSEIPLLMKEIEAGYEVVQGSRYLAGGHSGGMPLYRKFATRLHPLLMRLFTGYPWTDTTNGFRAIRLTLFDDSRINIEQPWLDRYELEPYILFKAVKTSHRVTEVPVTKIYPPHELGYTKMKPITGWWSILKPVFLLGLGLKK